MIAKPRAFSAMLLISMGSIGADGQIASAPPRILAIGTINDDANLNKLRAILPTEARETVKLYLQGKIDQWFSLRDRKGVVFILNQSNIAAASAMLEQLPLGRARLMHFDLMPIGPLEPLQLLKGAPVGMP